MTQIESYVRKVTWLPTDKDTNLLLLYKLDKAAKSAPVARSLSSRPVVKVYREKTR